MWEWCGVREIVWRQVQGAAGRILMILSWQPVIPIKGSHVQQMRWRVEAPLVHSLAPVTTLYCLEWCCHVLQLLDASNFSCKQWSGCVAANTVCCSPSYLSTVKECGVLHE